MWEKNWRDQIWGNLDQPWDLIIVGGGITGAGLLREATQFGLRCLLVESVDFSYGTSSRSSKLVHGGFRYLKNRQYSVTRESVGEREWLLKEANPLVTQLAHLIPVYKRSNMQELRIGLAIYDLFGGKWAHRALHSDQMVKMIPAVNTDGLMGGFEYYDAQVDDSRLVLRIIREAVRQGATAINYVRAESLLRNRQGQVCGLRLVDTAGLVERSIDVQAKIVINAAGPWSDFLRTQVGAPPKIRKLRGSHLIISRQKLPISEAISLSHPKDRRGMFLLPWEGVSLVGTTDVDHDPRLEDNGAEPFASEEEIEYILEALHATLPGIEISQDDILSTFSGLRPIVYDGDVPPSKASRKHVILVEDGLLTITGGKLTIFRLMADQTLKVASRTLPQFRPSGRMPRFFDAVATGQLLQETKLPHATVARLVGRYGVDACEIVNSAGPQDFSEIGESNVLWGELKFAARKEGIVHLDDLLLRRVRLGLLLADGGRAHLEQIRAAVQPLLGWDEARWRDESTRYLDKWSRFYSPLPVGMALTPLLEEYQELKI